MYFSFVIPTFNRKDEVVELLESFLRLENPTSDNFKGFEIIFADGSPTEVLNEPIQNYKNRLSINHIHRPKLAISPSRNLGAKNAKGDYLIFLDSDVILPQGYLIAIVADLEKNNWDSFGGPDAAHESFTDIQKAINFSMTSYLTTGGIRGQKKQIHNYNPRGFNMGIRKTVFEDVNGYSDFVCGEDIELSIRIINAGYKVGLIPDAFVYHKRRNTLVSFFRQVHRFGAARINIFYRHRTELKATHAFPTVFITGLYLGWLSYFIWSPLLFVWSISYSLYFLGIFFTSLVQYKSLKISFLSLVTSFLQLSGYGIGFIRNAFSVFVLKNQNGLALGASK